MTGLVSNLLVHLLCSNGVVNRPRLRRDESGIYEPPRPTTTHVHLLPGAPPLPPPSLPPPLWHIIHSSTQIPGECKPFWKDGQHCVAGASNCRLKVDVDLVITPNSCADYKFQQCWYGWASGARMYGHMLDSHGICSGTALKITTVFAKVCSPERFDECVLPPLQEPSTQDPISYSYGDEQEHPRDVLQDVPHCRAFEAGRV